jgi:hypothetical protein
MTKPGDPTKPSGDDRDRTITRLEKALGEALTRIEAAESSLDDQRQRLKALGLGREETMRTLTETRDELRRISQERDELRKQLARVDGVQTSTIALPDDDPGPSPATGEVPSLDELMSVLGNLEEPPGNPVAGHLHQRVQAPRDADSSEEMISPALVFPEQYAATAESAEQQAPVSRILVLRDAERPIKYPLYKETMTIGRADVADIQIDNGFLSRLHARVVSTADGVAIEDYESKTGIRVNTKIVTRQTLKHGDIVDLGRLRFRYIDAANEGAD